GFLDFLGGFGGGFFFLEFVELGGHALLGLIGAHVTPFHVFGDLFEAVEGVFDVGVVGEFGILLELVGFVGGGDAVVYEGVEGTWGVFGLDMVGGDEADGGGGDGEGGGEGIDAGVEALVADFGVADGGAGLER